MEFAAFFVSGVSWDQWVTLLRAPHHQDSSMWGVYYQEDGLLGAEVLGLRGCRVKVLSVEVWGLGTYRATAPSPTSKIG